MKSVKFFLICWLCIHVCLLFPLQSQAEEQNVPEQNINEVNVQEENKEVQEQPEQVEMKQDKEEQQEVKNEQETEKKIETDQGIITINKRELKVGEEVRIIVEPKEKNIQSIKGMLRLPKNSNLYEQERMIPFDYEEETKRWIANYKVGIFDLQGDWKLQLIQSFKENEKEELIENEVKVPLIRIKKETPTMDKGMPKLHKVTIDEATENVIERKRGDSIRVRVKAADVESVVKEVRVTLKGKENKEITFLLDYNKRDMEWQKVFEIEPLTDNKEVNNTKAQKDKDNNNQVISKKKEKKEEPEDKKETKSDHGIQASNVFAIMSGLFVLFLVLKSNKEWG